MKIRVGLTYWLSFIDIYLNPSNFHKANFFKPNWFKMKCAYYRPTLGMLSVMVSSEVISKLAHHEVYTYISDVIFSDASFCLGSILFCDRYDNL